MSSDLYNYQWHALRTRPGFENLVARQLMGKGYEEYLPLNKSSRRPGRIGTTEMPLFPGYTFCKFPVQDKLPILMMPGVLYIVGSGEAPTAISEAEISSLQRVIGCGLHCEFWPFIEAGQSVSIERGPLAGVIGTIVTKRSRSRLILSVALLQRSVAVEIDADSIEQVLSHETRLRRIQVPTVSP